MNKIKFIVMDVDGTLTDGKIYINKSGECFKVFNIKDGLGIKDLLAQNDISPVIITGRESEILAIRCKELGINMLYQGVKNKVQKIFEIGLDFNNTAYIGDDLNDIEAMKLCALKGCPADAAEEVKAVCDFISNHNGGDGAVRDFIEYIIKST